MISEVSKRPPVYPDALYTHTTATMKAITKNRTPTHPEPPNGVELETGWTYAAPACLLKLCVEVKPGARPPPSGLTAEAPGDRGREVDADPRLAYPALL